MIFSINLQSGVRRSLKVRSSAYFYLTTDGPKPKSITGDGGDLDTFWSLPTKWVDGVTQETCRDNGHHSCGYLTCFAYFSLELYFTIQSKFMSAKAQAIKMVVALLMGGVSAVSAREPRVLDLQGVEFHNPTGKSASFAAGGTIDPNGTFFQVLGTNGRSCATCHQPSDGWGLSA